MDIYSSSYLKYILNRGYKKHINIIKAINNLLIANTKLDREKLKEISVKAGKKIRFSTLFIYIQYDTQTSK